MKEKDKELSEERKVKRVQFDFAPDTWDLLEQMRKDTHVSSKAEVIRRSIALYSWFTEQIEDSYTIEVKDKSGDLVFKMKGKFFKF